MRLSEGIEAGGASGMDAGESGLGGGKARRRGEFVCVDELQCVCICRKCTYVVVC